MSVAAAISKLRAPGGARLTVRLEMSASQHHQVLRGHRQPPSRTEDAGAMLTVYVPGGCGYCATADLTSDGLELAMQRAHQWAIASRDCGLFDGLDWPLPNALRAGTDPGHAGTIGEAIGDAGAFVDPRLRDASAIASLLEHESVQLKGADARIVHWLASLSWTARQQWLFVDGQCVSAERHSFVSPNLEATASDGMRAQTRTLGGQYNGFCQQGGFEVVERSGLVGAGQRIAAEAVELLNAPNCPSGRMAVLLMPDQMMLQIHESIGHPLELDRILGDERNFAGTSFVTPDMFGTYRYGSEWLNVSFDPEQSHGFASYGHDDDGMPASKQWLIRDGVLLRPLGSALSQARIRADGLSLDGVANARACGWHRAPIDRMGNVNIEPGQASLEQMVAAVDRGVLMKTNVSWSIDDSRNKFQFGCEWGQLIEGGRLTTVVRNPNYRGVSATFWRNLAMVGDRSTLQVLGTPYCGKGEPGQVIRVGHTSPACLFRDVEVFGAQS